MVVTNSAFTPFAGAGSYGHPGAGGSIGSEVCRQIAKFAAHRYRFPGVDVRDDRAAAADFVRDRGLTYDSVFDPPGRTLAALRGYPRNTVPSTIVLDRQHRVAAVYLTAIRVPELIPLVQRLAAEPAPVGDVLSPDAPLPQRREPSAVVSVLALMDAFLGSVGGRTRYGTC